MAKQMLLQYCRDPTIMSNKLKDKVNKLFREHSKEIDVSKLHERLQAHQKKSETTGAGAIELKK